MPPYCNKWLLGAIALSMGLHFMILEIDFLSVCKLCIHDLVILLSFDTLVPRTFGSVIRRDC